MAQDDRNPGADTSSFRAFVDHPDPETPASGRTMQIVVAGVVIVVIAALAVMVLT